MRDLLFNRKRSKLESFIYKSNKLIFRKETFILFFFVDRLFHFSFVALSVFNARGAYPKERENRVSTRTTCIKRGQVQYIYSLGKSKRTSSIFLYIKEKERKEAE